MGGGTMVLSATTLSEEGKGGRTQFPFDSEDDVYFDLGRIDGCDVNGDRRFLRVHVQLSIVFGDNYRISPFVKLTPIECVDATPSP